MDNDALAILTFIVDRKRTSTRDVCSAFDFNVSRVIDIVEYLDGKDFVSFHAKLVDRHIIGIKPTSDGIDFVNENKSLINKIFRKLPKIEINLIKIG